ncbi:hypothetical protein [Priestia megaterium]|uniref:hypothetical protein n=1 Tax=Priestia megaterium TaxID=1404 RepID=UPI000BFC678D|nr:hypothetical protein [Priestia megaterium]PGQ88191.1 hypothetical protein COA18_04505 [Priestia megaterium]
MIMQLVNKKIDFIDLYIFLKDIEIVSIESDLHNASLSLLDEIEEKGFSRWKGKVFTKETLLETLSEEEGFITEYLTTHTSIGPVTVLKCSSGNGFTITLKNENQVVQLYQYLLDYVSGSTLVRTSLMDWEKEFLEIVDKYDRSFGRMMQIISTRWQAKDPSGALTVGACAGIVNHYGTYHQILDENKEMRKALSNIETYEPLIDEDFLTQLYDLKQIAIDAIHPF